MCWCAVKNLLTHTHSSDDIYLKEGEQCRHAEHTVETLLTGERWTAGLQYSWKEWRSVEHRQVDRQQQLKYSTKKLSYLIFLSLLQHCNKPERTFNFSNPLSKFNKKASIHWQDSTPPRASNGGRPLCVQVSTEMSYTLPIYWYHLKGNWFRDNFAADSFYIMKLCSRLLVLYCQNCPKDDKFGHLIAIPRKLGAA